MEHPASTDVDPAQLARSEAFWHTFIQLSKYAVIAIVVFMIGLAVFFT